MANDRDAPAENFKRALTLAMKTIAEEPELTCSFGAEHPGITDKRARLPQVTRDSTAADLAVTRGLSDAMAMRLANHSASVHARYQPQGQQALKRQRARRPPRQSCQAAMRPKSAVF